MACDWRTAWAWPAVMAKQVAAAGLSLSEVVAVAEPGTGRVDLFPAPEYAHLDDAIPAAMVAAAAAKHGGQALRVVVR
eukprot:contig_15404_g3675